MAIHRCLTLVPLLVALTTHQASAQARRSDEISRPPALLDSSQSVRMLMLVQSRLTAVESAFQRADTVALAAVLGADLIPPSEVAEGASRGCSTLGDMLQQMRSRRQSRRFGLRDTPTIGLREHPSARGDTVLVQVRVASGQRGSDAVLEFTREGDALVLVRARGLYGAVCSLSSASALSPL